MCFVYEPLRFFVFLSFYYLYCSGWRLFTYCMAAVRVFFSIFDSFNVCYRFTLGLRIANAKYLQCNDSVQYAKYSLYTAHFNVIIILYSLIAFQERIETVSIGLHWSIIRSYGSVFNVHKFNCIQLYYCWL